VERLSVPRRIADAVRRIAALLPKLETGRGGRFVRTSVYPLASQVLDLSVRAREETPVDGGRTAVTPIRSRPHGKRMR
jgi:poly(A) polymerase